MRVEVKEVGPCRKSVKVEVPAERVAAEYARILDRYAKEARLPGFRPGRAPRNVVERRLGRQILEAVRERLIPESCHHAIEQEKLNAVAILGVQDVSLEVGQPLTFRMELDVPPDFALPAYKGIEVAGRKVDVSEEEVTQALNELRAQYATFEDVKDRGVRKGDFVQIDYEGVCEGRSLEEVCREAGILAKGKDFWFRADDEAFLPGLVDQLLGAAVGEKRQVLVDFGEGVGPAELAGKKATYFVDVKAIREEKLPEVNQEFVQRFKVESEEALRERIRGDLREVAQGRERDRLKGEIIRHLLQQARFDLPESLVRRETRNVVYEIVQAQAARGVEQKALEERQDEIYQAALRSASERLRLRYILLRIAEAEGVQVGDEEVAAQIQRWAARYGMEPVRLRAELEKRQAVEDLREDLRTHKTLDFLLDHAKVRM